MSEAALATGTLIPLATKTDVYSSDGAQFPVRILAHQAKKDQDKKERPADFNPFLPPEPHLTVCDLDDGHVCVLNKFNVLTDHLLVVSRDFEQQTDIMSVANFRALATIMHAGSLPPSMVV